MCRCIADLDKASSVLGSLFSEVEQVVSPDLTLTLESLLRQLGQKLANMTSSCQMRFGEVKGDLSSWRDVRDTFLHQSRQYWNVGVGKLTEEAHTQLSGEKVERQLVVLLLHHCVTRLEAVKKTTQRWKETRAFQRLDSNMREILKEIEEANATTPWYYFSFSNWLKFVANTISKVLPTTEASAESEVQEHSDLRESIAQVKQNAQHLIDIFNLIDKLVLALSSATSDVIGCWNVIQSRNESQTKTEKFEDKALVATLKSYLDKLASCSLSSIEQ